MISALLTASGAAQITPAADKAALEYTAGSSVLPTALNPAAQTHGFASPRVETLGRRTTTRTLKVALQSGGEADFSLFPSGGRMVVLGKPLGGGPSSIAEIGVDQTSRKCPSARNGLRWYRGRYAEHRARMGAALSGEGASPKTRPAAPGSFCPRYLARVYRTKARNARRAYERWYERNFHWQVWLPDVWARLGACETGYGKRPGNWRWDSGTYVSAFGIYRPGYADDARRVGLPTWDDPGRRTPREQYLTALSHYRAHGGFSGWGCRGS